MDTTRDDIGSGNSTSINHEHIEQSPLLIASSNNKGNSQNRCGTEDEDENKTSTLHILGINEEKTSAITNANNFPGGIIIAFELP